MVLLTFFTFSETTSPNLSFLFSSRALSSSVITTGAVPFLATADSAVSVMPNLQAAQQVNRWTKEIAKFQAISNFPKKKRPN